MNETYFVKIHGKVNVPEKLGIGHNYRLTADCSVVSESKEDNEDGTFSVISKLVPITVEVMRDNGETVKAKDPRKNSQKMRNYLFKIYYEDGCIEAFNEVYDAFTWEVMSRMQELFEAAVRRIQK